MTQSGAEKVERRYMWSIVTLVQEWLVRGQIMQTLSYTIYLERFQVSNFKLRSCY